MSEADSSREPIVIHYVFAVADGRSSEFQVRLDPETLAYIAEPRESYPAWTALEHHRCPNCPLAPGSRPRCPVAANMVELVEFFRASQSFEQADVSVITRERIFLQHCTLQKSISGIAGIINVTSGCPILDRLRPMVATHLPFATLEETTFRMLSTHMVAQYFRHARGQEVDWSLQSFVRNLEEVARVDAALCRRLRSAEIADASLNAMITLCFSGDYAALSFQEKSFERWEKLFRVYLD